MTEIRQYLKEQVLLFDGAMGTYFSSGYSDPHYRCEYANLTSPHTIREIHRRYLQAGAKSVKTNTFSLFGEEEAFSAVELVRAGYQLAQEVAKDFGAYVFCDIGPIQSSEADLSQRYQQVIDTFLDLGGTHFLFETFLEGETVNHWADYIKERLPEAYIIASFAIDADGFTAEGQWGSALLEGTSPSIDCTGFNCICGPHHMTAHVKANQQVEKPRSVMPNASYPVVLGHRLSYENNPEYFAKQMAESIGLGARVVGGCCGTTPQFIQAMAQIIHQGKLEGKSGTQVAPVQPSPAIHQSQFYKKLMAGEKPIAVELDSPLTAQVAPFMANAATLKAAGVDLMTIADCPVARARMDSSLLACKVKRELQMDVMPHLTCRDRNVNATRALLLGLSAEEITDVLVVTGDPVPSAQRSEVKAVYEFNSRMLTQHISGLNQSLFDSPFYLYAALNINARNFDIQLNLAKNKVARGTMAFFTQPVLSREGLDNLKRAKETLGVPIVGGIFPIVSHRNAVFLNNEVPGITVCQEVMNCYLDKTQEECAQEAVLISTTIARAMAPYVDGYYLITPFQRVELMTEIIKGMPKGE